MVVVFCQQGLAAQKKKKSERSGDQGKCHTAALHYRIRVFEEGAGQTPFRTDSVTQPVQGERERIKPVFVVFSQ